MAIGSEWKAMFEGLKRDMYRRILINHNQVPAALAEQRARTEPLEEIERHIELWGHNDVHKTCDCGVPLGVWQQITNPQH
jgi:hypothetical protein